MAGPELKAFRELDKMGLILEGEFYSPFLASSSHYTNLLDEFKKIQSDKKDFNNLGCQSQQSC